MHTKPIYPNTRLLWKISSEFDLMVVEGSCDLSHTIWMAMLDVTINVNEEHMKGSD